MSFRPQEYSISSPSTVGSEPIPSQLLGDMRLYPGSDTPAQTNSFVAEAYNDAEKYTARLTVHRNPDLVSGAAEKASGSGVVISSDGQLITDLHVVEDAASIKVHLNGRDYAGHVVMLDNQSDLAVVQINKNSPGQTFAAADLAASSQVEDNQSLGVYGFPDGNHELYFSPANYSDRISMLQLAGSVQGGLMPGENALRSIIEVNGKALPGNSGGPLFEAGADGKLELVGLVDLSDSQENIDATPVEDIRRMLAQTPGNPYYRPPDTMVAGNQPLYGAPGRSAAAYLHPFAGLDITAVQTPNATPMPPPASTDRSSISSIDSSLARLRQLFDSL